VLRRLGSARRRARRAVLGRRRLLAALCAGVAVLAALRATSAPPPPTVTVAVVARPLPAGAEIGSQDLARVALPPGAVPDDVLTDPVGRVLAGPIARGEPVTAARVVGTDLAADALAGTDAVALPVRLPDAGAVALLRVGDRVDLVATDPQTATSELVVTGVRVLALPAADGGSAAGTLGQPGGRLVVLGVPAPDVPRVSGAAGGTFLTYAWSR
jgi:Flp pilus assembly protein CpaB